MVRATRFILMTGMASAAFCAAAPAWAQESQAPAEQAQDQDIVVTATRRATSLQNVPISISALTGETIQEAGIGRIEDFSTQLPNVYITPRELRTAGISIRGIAADLNNPGLDQSVGVYVDGVYMGRAATLNTSLFDLERIEVLRGPQGTLYGRNTIAGAMNIITRLPGEDRLDAEASYGNYDAIRANMAGSVTLSPGTAWASAGVSIDRRDGYYLNTATDTRLDDADSLSGRVALRLKPGGGGIEIVLRADASRDRTHSGAYDVLNNGAFTGAPFADADPNDRIVAQDVNTSQDRDIWGVSAQIDAPVAGGTLTSITAYRTYEWHNIQDNDYSVLSLLATGIDEDQTQFSQEVRFVSPSGGRFDYVAGLYYFRQTLDTLSTVIVGPDLGIYPTPEIAAISADVTTDSYAAFGRASYAFTDQFTLSLGARYTIEDKSLVFSQTGDPFEVIAPTIPQRTIDRRDENFSPSATLEWRPAERILAYATVAAGFKSGGFNVFSVTATDDAEYRPEKVVSYEIGIRTELLDRRIRLNAAFFYMDYTNLQQNQLITSGGGIARYQTSNAAEAHSAGFEMDIAARLGSRLEATASYGYSNAEFDAYPDATPAGADYTGNRLAFAPRHSASAALEWSPDLTAGLRLYTRGEIAYRSRIYFGSDNRFSDDGLALLNARIGIGPASGAWRATLWGRNLTDATYAINQAAGAVVPDQTIQALGAPRTYGVELRFGF
jgi:iron complex outermembrane receptor protein